MKHIKVFIFSAFALVSAVTLRTIQLLFLTDAKTGFYKEGMEGIGTALMVLLIGVIAVASTLVFMFSKQKLSPTPSSSALLGCVALFAGIANIAEPFLNEISFSAVPAVLLGLRTVMIIASGAVFCWYGIAILFGTKLHASLCIIPIITWVIRLMSSFICFTGMSNISENLYDVLMLISTLISLLLFGKAVCKISKSTTNRKLFASGIAAVLFTSVSSLPCIIAYITSDFTFVHIPVDSPITGLFMALFIAVYLLDICKARD
ncbi:MAG: hypothetical protein J6C29_01250 [Clostridia bacterium]|nr:hypothetical protein [Clostridia bacterium]